MGAIFWPAQIVWLLTAVNTGNGFTVIVNVIGNPLQPLAEGLAEIDAIIGAGSIFVAVKPGKLPVPLKGNPIDELEFVQFIVVLFADELNTIEFTVWPEQSVWEPIELKTGIGFTVIEEVTCPVDQV